MLRSGGVPTSGTHDLRHTAATQLLAQGVAPWTIVETLGHSQTSLTPEQLPPRHAGAAARSRREDGRDPHAGWRDTGALLLKTEPHGPAERQPARRAYAPSLQPESQRDVERQNCVHAELRLGGDEPGPVGAPAADAAADPGRANSQGLSLPSSAW